MNIIRNKKIINIIYIVLSIFLIISALGILIMIGSYIFSITNPEFYSYAIFLDIPVKITENGSILLNNGGVYDIVLQNAKISFNIINAYPSLKLLNFIFTLFIYILGSYIFYVLWRIFASLRKSIKANNPFKYSNIKRIKYIAYTIFAISLINIFYYLFLKYIWIKKIIIPDINMDIAINWESLELLFWGVIILVIAEVYRLGTEIKKEQELTI